MKIISSFLCNSVKIYPTCAFFVLIFIDFFLNSVNIDKLDCRRIAYLFNDVCDEEVQGIIFLLLTNVHFMKMMIHQKVQTLKNQGDREITRFTIIVNKLHKVIMNPTIKCHQIYVQSVFMQKLKLILGIYFLRIL